MRNALLFGGLVVALAVPNYAILQKEQLLDGGDVVLVELAPVDPRSLIQGDYMRLDYAIPRAVGASEWPRDGRLVVRLDADSVARYVRLYSPETPLSGDERLLQYRKRGRRTRIGSDAYFFQEGTARVYANAKYGELRVDATGASVLTGLRDENRRPLK
jgi:uncharacterized membrane-anchored protein